MKAIILAAGRGTRLGSMLQDKPKALLKFGDKTILERQLEQLNAVGVNLSNVWIVAGYKQECIAAIHPNIVVNWHYATTENSVSLALALDAVGVTDDVIVLDSDLIFDTEALASIIKSPYENAVLTIRQADTGESTGVVCDSEGRVMDIGKHIRDTGLIYASILKMSPRAAQFLLSKLRETDCLRTWYTLALARVCRTAPFYKVETTARWCEVDTLDDYIQAKRIFGINGGRIAITGARGFLGSKIADLLAQDTDVVRLVHVDPRPGEIAMDVADKASVYDVLNAVSPSMIIHCAGISSPDVAEADRVRAFRVNVEGTRWLVDWCSERGVKLVHISTDYVFDGQGKALQEDSPYRPLNTYGQTKAAAETLVKELREYLIVRLPILYGLNPEGRAGGPYFRSVLEAALRKEGFEADDTQIRYPVLVDEAAQAIKKLLDATGVVNLSSDVGVTKYEWAKIVYAAMGVDEAMVRPIRVAAKDRPKDNRFDGKAQALYGIRFSSPDIGIGIVRDQLGCALRAIYKAGPEQSFCGQNVAVVRLELGRRLACEAGVEGEVDYVMGVPDSGLFAALGYAEAIGLPYRQAIVRSSYVGRLFSVVDSSMRHQLTKEKLVPVVELIRGKRIVVVDEAIFSGLTLRYVCDVLRAAGATAIHCRIASPIVVGTCPNYMLPDHELLSNTVSNEEYAAYLGADSVAFLSMESFQDVMPAGTCMKCFGVSQVTSLEG